MHLVDVVSGLQRVTKNYQKCTGFFPSDVLGCVWCHCLESVRHRITGGLSQRELATLSLPDMHGTLANCPSFAVTQLRPRRRRKIFPLRKSFFQRPWEDAALAGLQLLRSTRRTRLRCVRAEASLLLPKNWPAKKGTSKMTTPCQVKMKMKIETSCT